MTEKTRVDTYPIQSSDIQFPKIAIDLGDTTDLRSRIGDRQ
ncbi:MULTISPECIES: hypothetical protein [unclassified Chamaesiphon]|nr:MULTISPECIES: hypothetical protein [unclassified Chamaesiphon]